MGKFYFDVKLNNFEPVYIQLVRYYKTALSRNLIADGDELPSRRELAANLLINPNTVQKAYAQLENETLIMTQNNVKSIAVITPVTVEKIKKELFDDYMKQFLSDMDSLNASYSEIIECIDKHFS